MLALLKTEHHTYSECRAQDCVFNVMEQDAKCPSCGISKPHRAHPNTEIAISLSSQWVGCYLIISMLVQEITHDVQRSGYREEDAVGIVRQHRRDKKSE